MNSAKLIAATAALAATFAVNADWRGSVKDATGFEGFTAGQPVTVDLQDSASAGGRFAGDKRFGWIDAGGAVNSSVISNYADTGVAAPTSFQENFSSAGDSYLNLNTEGGTLLRKLDVNGNAVAIDSEIYFDATLQFTLSEEAPDLTGTDAKIAVWMGKDGDANCLYANAGCIDDPDHACEFPTTNAVYKLGTWSGNVFTPFVPSVGTWYRVTIRAIKNVTTSSDYAIAGFEISVNGQKLAADTDTFTADAQYSYTASEEESFLVSDVKACFPPLGVSSGPAALNLTGMGFQGTGLVDNYVATTVFTGDVEMFDFTIDPVTGLKVNRVLDKDGNVITANDGKYTVAKDSVVDVYFVADGAYVLKGDGKYAATIGENNTAISLSDAEAAELREAAKVEVVIAGDESSVTSYYTSVDAAFKAAGESEAGITILAAVTMSEDATIAAGQSLTLSGDSTKAFTIAEGKTLTLNGGTLVCDAAGSDFNNQGKMVIGSTSSVYMDEAKMFGAGGKFTIADGKIEQTIITNAVGETIGMKYVIVSDDPEAGASANMTGDFPLWQPGVYANNQFYLDENSEFITSEDANAEQGAKCVLTEVEGKVVKYDAASHTYTVGNSAIKIDVPTAAEGLVYTGEEQIGVAEGTGYTLTDNKATDAGDYVATATLEDDYEWSDGSTDAKTISWSIAQAEVTITTAPTASAEIEKDAALSTISLVGGVASVDGSFAWTSPDTTVSKDGDFEVTFTPTDTKNYKTATCNVAVKVAVPVYKFFSQVYTNAAYWTWAGLGSADLPNGVQVSVTNSAFVPVEGKNYYVSKLELLDGDNNPAVCEFTYDGTTFDKKGTDGIGVELLADSKIAYKYTTDSTKCKTDSAGHCCFAKVYLTEIKSSEEPIEPGPTGGKTYDDPTAAANAADEINNAADKTKYVATPDGLTDAEKTTYASMFKATASGNKVTLDLDTENATLKGQVNDETAETALADPSGTATTVSATPGLYYWIEGGTGLDLGTNGTAVQAQTGETSVTITKPNLGDDAPKGFYRINVGCAAPAK